MTGATDLLVGTVKEGSALPNNQNATRAKSLGNDGLFQAVQRSDPYRFETVAGSAMRMAPGKAAAAWRMLSFRAGIERRRGYGHQWQKGKALREKEGVHPYRYWNRCRFKHDIPAE